MAKPFHLQPLVEYTQNQTDEASKRLALLKAQWQMAEDKLRQLVAYREEYQGRMARSAQVGMSVSALRDYQAFLGKIDTAIEQQKQEVARCQQSWEAGKEEWMAQRRKLKAYQTLEQRHYARESQREAKQEQKEQDESARHAFSRHRSKNHQK
ncbi:MAG: flagellar export protein FliJ [Sulfuricellaceae bacterium]|jgi:flagellar FliJ protein